MILMRLLRISLMGRKSPMQWLMSLLETMPIMHKIQLPRPQCSQTNSSIVLLQVFLEVLKPFGMECKEVALEEKSCYKCWPAKCSSASHLRRQVSDKQGSINIRPTNSKCITTTPSFPSVVTNTDFNSTDIIVVTS